METFQFTPSSVTDPNLPHDLVVSQIVGVCSAMLALVTVVVVIRFYIRLRLVRSAFGIDDWCILIAWMLAVAFDLDPLNQTRFGLGRHIYHLPADTDFETSLKLYYIGELIYYLCVAVTKIAILSLYLRLAVEKNFRRLIWACVAFVILSAGGCALAGIFQCAPIRKAWDMAGKIDGTCINYNALFIAHAGLDIFLDAIIYIMPMNMLYNLQVPRRQKVALMMVFAVGGFVVVTGVLRLHSLKVVQNTPDPSYDNYGAAIWSSIECNVGVVCASLPSFKTLIDRWFPNLLGQVRCTSLDLTSGMRHGEKRGYTRQSSPTDADLEHGGWCKSSEGNNSNANNANQTSNHAYGSKGSIKRSSAYDNEEGIWTSTSVMISRGER